MDLIILCIGITYYLLTIADRHSIILTLAGMKFLAILFIGIFIWVLNNFSPGLPYILSDILLRILIFICIFGIGTMFLDIIPVKELVYFFIKKVNKKEVAIDIGIGQIIELKKGKVKLIYNINIIIAIIQISSSIFIYVLISLFALDIISISNIIFGITVISQVTAEYLFVAVLTFLGISLTFGGIFTLYINKETKSLGI